jgi:ribulose-5-phosphate 4-epimerase/fuculose-1-phosphate aldolase
VQRTQIEAQLLEGCRRLAGKGFLNSSGDSFSLRIPGQTEMILISGQKAWRHIDITDVRAVPFSTKDDFSTLHAWIYQERPDVGAVTLSSPRGARLLASFGGALPPIFDEQARHIGRPSKPLRDKTHRDEIRRVFSRGSNVALLGDQLLCLGMTCDRVLFNTELYEKCAQAYVIASACGGGIKFIPSWVQMIANHRLLKDERIAALSYSEGRVPDAIHSY